ncbi:hypothetical protein OV203_46935 [Nannocystis sp. ILAH1]|uniref:hypothetical protein n=1 Tax=unclassified Nannocystis TaxID=2627009 RepID=UPI00226DF06F|nr:MULTISPECIES: hypothetical protein [unclassified Nannocystis]MCY0994752.1 hypothetical protein [Nannocystis sp. ILAH1]MCY1065378.1 hypothetical protein [Nannocystis sp. RBIL2]
MTWFLDKQFLEAVDLQAYDAAAIAARVGLPREAVAAFVDPGRRYWLKSCPEYGWLVGANTERKPTILFVGTPRLAADRSAGITETFAHRAADLAGGCHDWSIVVQAVT